MLSIFMFSFSNNYDAHQGLRLRFRQGSRGIRRILTPPRRGNGDEEDSSVHCRHVIHHDSEVQELQGVGVDLMESVQVECSDGIRVSCP